MTRGGCHQVNGADRESQCPHGKAAQHGACQSPSSVRVRATPTFVPEAVIVRPGDDARAIHPMLEA
jgi:hypothetical protein